MAAGLETVDETEIFSGIENRLIMTQTYTRNFQCNYALSAYPFDTQVNCMKTIDASDYQSAVAMKIKAQLRS